MDVNDFWIPLIWKTDQVEDLVRSDPWDVLKVHPKVWFHLLYRVAHAYFREVVDHHWKLFGLVNLLSVNFCVSFHTIVDVKQRYHEGESDEQVNRNRNDSYSVSAKLVAFQRPPQLNVSVSTLNDC